MTRGPTLIIHYCESGVAKTQSPEGRIYNADTILHDLIINSFTLSYTVPNGQARG
jgi:hypothetical protein